MKNRIVQVFDAIGWSKRQWIFFLVVTAFFAVPVVVFWKVPTLSEWLILLTGLVVLIYTVETHALRTEMVRQNDISIQPLIVVGLKGPIHEERIFLKNIGHGTALHVRIDDIQLGGEVVGDVAGMRDRVLGNVAKFTSFNFIEAGQETFPQIICATDRIAGSINLDFTPNLIPRVARENYQLTIRYQDIDGRPHASVMRVGEAGVELLSRR